MNYNDLDLKILKAVVSNKKHSIDFCNDYDAKLFSVEVWNFANIVINYVKTYKDLPTLRVLVERLGSNEQLKENITNIWNTVDNVESNDKEFRHDVEKLKKRFAEKQILNVKDNLSKLDASSVDVNKAVSDLQKTVQNIKNLDGSKSYNVYNIKDYLPMFVEKFNQKKENPELEVGIKTKYSFLDFATNGLRDADFVLIAGESGFGKSLFLKNIGVQIWMQDNNINITENFSPGKNIAYFSLEMPYEDCFNRLLSRLSGVASRNIENSSLNKDDFSKVKKALNFIKNYPYNFKIIDIADACANDIETILLNSEEKFDAVFIDYLGIMKTNEKNDEADWLKQGTVSYEVRAIARKFKIPIFSAVQLNRKSSGKESSESIGLSRLARSGTIATHATHVIQIESRPNEELHPDFLYHIIKNRKGPKGKGTLYKNLSCATLIDKESSSDDEFTSSNYFTNDISNEIEKLDL